MVEHFVPYKTERPPPAQVIAVVLRLHSRHHPKAVVVEPRPTSEASTSSAKIKQCAPRLGALSAAMGLRAAAPSAAAATPEVPPP